MQTNLSRKINCGIILLLLVMISGVSTAAEINMDFVSRLGGGITGVAVQAIMPTLDRDRISL
jgi:hypothetical protein